MQQDFNIKHLDLNDKDENGENIVVNGVIERITYRNEENGFTVMRLKIKNKKELLTIVGEIATIAVGETVTATGKWFNDLRYGLQLKATNVNIILPNTIDGIKKYLGSGLIKGIGPHYAAKIVNVFGLDTIVMLENSPEKLLDIKGLGKNKAELIAISWRDNKNIRDIMIFLQSHNVTTAMANKIFRNYGADSINILKTNPYKLAKDIRGVGFLSADKIAINMGVDPNSIQRASAAINYILNESASNGHCCLPEGVLLDKVEMDLRISRDILVKALKEEITNKDLISVEQSQLESSINDTLNNNNDDIANNNDDIIDSNAKQIIKEQSQDNLIFLPVFLNCEKYIAKKLIELNSYGDALGKDIDIHNAIIWLETEYKIRLSDSQKQALKIITTNKVSVITGGPGTGKTTLINSLVKILGDYNLNNLTQRPKIKLAAPTGRAAKRLSESTKKHASTIHRLLEFDPATGGFKYNAQNQLKCDLLILDESSMIDVQLISMLLKALSPNTNLIFVGDIDQIPSVGPGQILVDIINSGVLPVVRLNKIFRQAANSNIITNAHLINKGMMPKLSDSADNQNSDFWFCEALNPEAAVRRIGIILQHELVQIIKDGKMPRLNHRARFKNTNVENEDGNKNVENTNNDINNYDFDIKRDVQILSPMQKGSVGVKSLNIELQKILNPQYSMNSIEKYGQTYGIGDKVIQTENNYEKLVFNGDIGFIIDIDKENQKLIINFDYRDIDYNFDELDQICLAYAITIHKSQGSEYPIVIIPIMTQHFVMLNKNLLYTAITRGKNLVILVGQRNAIGMAVSNQSISKRYTKLRDWLIDKKN